METLRARHYSRRTEQAYIHWIRRFIRFHGSSHPRQLTEGDVNRFLSNLAIQENVAHSPLDRLRKGLSVQSRGIMRTEVSG